MPLAVLLALGALADYRVAWSPATAAYDQALMDTALALAANIKRVHGQFILDLPPVADQVLRTDQYDRIYYAVRAPGGTLLAGNADLPPPPALEADKRRAFYDGEIEGQPVRVAVLAVPLSASNLLVQVAETGVKRSRLVREILVGMLLPEVLFALAAITLVWLGVGRGLKPLEWLQAEIAARSVRDLSPVSELRAPVEVRRVLHALNDLLWRLAEAMSTQQRFLANAAHQLRTPLAGLQTQAELALRQTDPAELRHTLVKLHEAAARTAHLGNQLLTLARAEAGEQRPEGIQSLDLADAGREAAERVPQALAKDIDLGFELQAAPMLGDPLLLHEMLANLLDNAIAYTPRGGQVTVRTYVQDGAAVLEVEDDGPGIPQAERDKVLERFYRIEGTPGQGCGLGLAIVQEIALAHAGMLEITPAKGEGGTRVTVRFPGACGSEPRTD